MFYTSTTHQLLQQSSITFTHHYFFHKRSSSIQNPFACARHDRPLLLFYFYPLFPFVLCWYLEIRHFHTMQFIVTFLQLLFEPLLSHQLQELFEQGISVESFGACENDQLLFGSGEGYVDSTPVSEKITNLPYIQLEIDWIKM